MVAESLLCFKSRSSFTHLLHFKHVIDKETMEFFIGIIDAQLLETKKEKIRISVVNRSLQRLISSYDTTTWSNIQITRINKMITKGKMTCCVYRFSVLIKLYNLPHAFFTSLCITNLFTSKFSKPKISRTPRETRPSASPFKINR